MGIPRSYHIMDAYKEIVHRYCDPRRYYHTLEHIDYCLTEAQRIRFLFNRPNEAMLALIFHDIVREPGMAYDMEYNKVMSARLAKHMLTDIGMPDSSIQLVSRLIMVTAYHQSSISPSTPDEALIRDVDFSPIGLWEHDFVQNEKLIEKEDQYLQKGNKYDYYRKRAAFIDGVLKLPTIYYTRHFREQYEEIARNNLQNSLKRIEKRLASLK
jgi:predicted metal-dependent HD superfamily phosphohydrolase